MLILERINNCASAAAAESWNVSVGLHVFMTESSHSVHVRMKAMQ